MRIYEILITSWDKPYLLSCQNESISELLKVGERVILRSKSGIDLAEIVAIKEVNESPELVEKIKEFSILRKASEEDCQKYNYLNQEEKIKEAIEVSNKLVKKHNLPIKIMGAYFSFDGGRITFLFTAPDRVDFRELVKNLTQEFHKSIRLHQVGIRQALEFSGDIGSCGRPICCKDFLKELGKITTDLIADQNLFNRGADRLTGICGRLKCCLLFEEEDYKKSKAPVARRARIPIGKQGVSKENPSIHRKQKKSTL
ncbi:MAG: hypothetical protein BWY03_00168 [Parcubacteria group bacterium ADurb.Bin159]|jgi:cell fate regulator YaaT (PSP1 superfamily)|nr:MAG: hypothetical protein BWY03_00168 [Parcubacteria group bacterium ADurb.Bin159]